MPEISVIIPCYNNHDYIQECLDSVLNQTFSDFEVILVDDGSTDGTTETVKAYLPKLKLISQKNQGPAVARNVGLEEATGKYVAFQDADDLWYPEKLELQLKFLESNPRFDWVYADMSTFNDQQRLQASWFADRPTYQGKVFEKLINNNFIPTITVMAKKEAVLSVGGFDPSLRSCEDKDLWLRLARKNELGRLDKVLAKRRFHTHNLCRDNQLLIASEIKVMQKMKSLVEEERLQRLLDNKISRLYFELGYFHFARNELTKAREYFRQSNRQEAFDWKSRLYYYSTFLDQRFLGFLKTFKNLGRTAASN
jgi:glycosyltransferase involved in cell wall biosynthesis